MRFISYSLIPLAFLLTLVNASSLLVKADLESRQACSIVLCGAAAPGVNCCPNLFCSSNNRCSACGISAGFCGPAANNVPCCAGLFCSASNRCTSCIQKGGLCQLLVPCCSGLCPTGTTCQ
ncbi:hypothetical protein C8J57DRAFT_1274574 [Mycena rebaudengoi]|nr:hypothetical protein C8J57DRAFT_1274574 [Mycena rebaudengoi]